MTEQVGGISIELLLESQQFQREFQAVTGRIASLEQTSRGIGVTKRELLGLNTAATQSDNIFLRFRKTLDGFEGRLKGIGLDSQDLAVILGAGLAGGVAFAIRSVVRFGIEIVTLSARINELERISEEAFGEASNVIEEFADKSITALGLSRRETLEFTNALGISFKNLGFAERDAAKLSTTLTTVATALARSTGGAKSTADALDAIRAAVLRQEFDPIENFNIKLKDTELRQEAVRLKLAETTKEVDKQALSIAAISLITGDSETALQLLADSEGTLAEKGDILNAQLDELKTAMGDVLLPVVLDLVENINTLLGGVRILTDFFGLLSDEAEEAEGPLGTISKIFSDIQGVFRKSGIQNIVDTFKRFTGGAGDTQEAIDDLADSTDLYTAFLNAETQQIELTSDELQRLEDAHRRVNRAVQDGERRVDEAERNLSRVEEDTNRRVHRALESRRRAYRDAARTIADAQEKLNETIADGELKVRDAEENLADARRDSRKEREKEIEDLENLERRRAEAILDATIAVGQAIREGNVDAQRQAFLELSRAQQNEDIKQREDEIEDDRKERMLEISRLQRELAETEIEVREDVADAVQELAEAEEDAAERIVDAENAVTDAIRERDQAQEDAARRLIEAQRETREAIDDAILALDRLEEKLGDSAEKAKVLADQMNRLKDILLNPVFTDKDRLRDRSSRPSSDEDLADLLLGRQHGGPFNINTPFLAGEDKKPELIIPNTHGTVASSRQIINALQQIAGNTSGGLGGSPSITINKVADNEEATAFAVWSRLLAGVNN